MLRLEPNLGSDCFIMANTTGCEQHNGIKEGDKGKPNAYNKRQYVQRECR